MLRRGLEVPRPPRAETSRKCTSGKAPRKQLATRRARTPGSESEAEEEQGGDSVIFNSEKECNKNLKSLRPAMSLARQPRKKLDTKQGAPRDDAAEAETETCKARELSQSSQSTWSINCSLSAQIARKGKKQVRKELLAQRGIYHPDTELDQTEFTRF
jgi:hypothetical protein